MVPPPCALCEVVGHPTNMCPKLDEVQTLLHAPKAPVNPPPPIGDKITPAHYKAFHTNHACAICMEYWHYTHHCPKIPRYQDALGARTQENTMTPSLSTDDWSKTIFYVTREEYSCSYPYFGPSSYRHARRQPALVTTERTSMCTLCDKSNHFISQCIDIWAFRRYYPNLHTNLSNRTKCRCHRYHICSRNHHS